MNTPLQNLYALLDTGERILANPLGHALGFGRVDCGTYACFMGWHVRYHGNDARLVRHWIEGGYFTFGSLDHILEHFGITDPQFDMLFGSVRDNNEIHSTELDENADRPGPEAFAELRRRVTYLRELIAEREASLGVEPRAQRSAA